MATDTPTPKPEPQPFSFGNAVLALEEMFDAIPKSRRVQWIGHYNEISVVLTAAAGLLNVVRDSEQWDVAVSKLPRPEWPK